MPKHVRRFNFDHKQPKPHRKVASFKAGTSFLKHCLTWALQVFRKPSPSFGLSSFFLSSRYHLLHCRLPPHPPSGLQAVRHPAFARFTEARLRARVNTHSQRGESPLQVVALRPEADCNCVAERQGGEQQEANDQSAGIRTRFGLMISASLRRKGEATYPQERVICRACGVAKKRRQRDMGCLGAEWTEGYARKHGDPVRGGDRAGSQSVHSSGEVG